MLLTLGRRVAAALCIALLWSPRAAAQDEGLVLMVSTPDRPASTLRIEGISLFDGKLLEPQIGAQVTMGRLTMIGAFDVQPAVGGQPPPARHAEWLARVVSSSRVHVAAGSGVRHEAGGRDVMLGRVVADVRAAGGRLTGNLLLERALGAGRDAADVITSVGWTRPVGRGVHLGAEMRVEDLEGFWSAQEAEGGARLFVGPSLVFHPSFSRWTLRATAGRDVRATGSTVSLSDAARLIGLGTSGGFAARVAFNRSF
jgi:hypothetical protein